MKSQKIVLFTLVVLALFLVACSGNTKGGDDNTNYNPFIGGTNAIKMEFIPGMPPDQAGALLDNKQTPFSIGIKLSNEGEYDIIPPGNTPPSTGDYGKFLQLSIRGVLPSQFGLTSDDLIQTLDVPLTGAKKNLDGTLFPGQFTTLTFNGFNYQEDIVGDLPKTFAVDACYDYATKSTTPVCLTNDVTKAFTNAQDQAICSVSGAKDAQNSAGPVQITDFQQLPQGNDKVSVIFTVSHVGTGQIFKEDTACNFAMNNPDKNVVYLDVHLPESTDATIECVGGTFQPTSNGVAGFVTLYESPSLSRKITCSITENSDQELIYVDLLGIDMYYRYGQTLEKTILIKDNGNFN